MARSFSQDTCLTPNRFALYAEETIYGFPTTGRREIRRFPASFHCSCPSSTFISTLIGPSEGGTTDFTIRSPKRRRMPRRGESSRLV